MRPAQGHAGLARGRPGGRILPAAPVYSPLAPAPARDELSRCRRDADTNGPVRRANTPFHSPDERRPPLVPDRIARRVQMGASLPAPCTLLARASERSVSTH